LIETLERAAETMPEDEDMVMYNERSPVQKAVSPSDGFS
jgi:hypothetical protein